MTRLYGAVVVGLTFSCVVACHAQTGGTGGGFREVLDIVGLGPDVLGQLNTDELPAADWQVVSQILGRLKQHNDDLKRWTLPKLSISPESVGELVEVTGTVRSAQELTAPVPVASGLELTKLYRCQVKIDSASITVLSESVPLGWDLSKPLSEPVSLTGVLLAAAEPMLLSTHVSWFPVGGLPSGQLLLARHGMDATLWEEIAQKTAFITAERSREAEAFYAGLAALRKVGIQELAKLTREHISESVAARDPGDPKFAAAISEQADQGLSSVVPLFLQPEKHVGELVRIEGTARRAVRVAVEKGENPILADSIREYYELEVFTPDSQNYPVVCCVTKLPAGFPFGDAIRTGVRVDGVFFKLWRYRSRKLVDGAGETAAQQRSYTPIVLGGAVTWLQQATAERSWWGIVVGGFVFAVIMIGLARAILFSRDERRRRLPDVLPNGFRE